MIGDYTEKIKPTVSLGRPSPWILANENRTSRRPVSFDIGEKMRMSTSGGAPVSGGLGDALAPLIKELSPVLKEVGSALGKGLRGDK